MNDIHKRQGVVYQYRATKNLFPGGTHVVPPMSHFFPFIEPGGVHADYFQVFFLLIQVHLKIPYQVVVYGVAIYRDALQVTVGCDFKKNLSVLVDHLINGIDMKRKRHFFIEKHDIL